MGFKCGIVGLPNVGKSTLFNALTKASIAAENYPFCTIEPNVGMVPVPDLRLTQLAEIVSPEQIVPTTIQFVDIAGLVKGAAEGQGLGNKFLAHIRETDAIGHVVRCFENSDIIHISGKIDPIDDIDTIHTELVLADLESVEKARLKIGKNSKSGNKEAIAEKQVLDILYEALGKGLPVRSLTLTSEPAKQVLKRLQLLSAKPTFYIANVDETGFENNPHLEKLEQLAKKEGARVIPISAKVEADLSDLGDEEKLELLNSIGLKEPGLNRLIREGYELLDLLTFFTAGPKEVRAWTVEKGSTAPQAAGRIHTDFEKGFIRAEIIAFDDYIRSRGEQGAKDAGKWRLEGKEYLVRDGDVVHFRFNV